MSVPEPRGSPVEVARRVAASHPGGGFALETDALEVARALGIGVPRYFTVPDASAVAIRHEVLPGDLVVVKVLGHDVVHKTDIGGVRVVSNNPQAIQAAIVEMPATDAGYLIEQYIPHESGPGKELLLGARWTEEFGPVVSFGPGGTYAEFLAIHAPGGFATLSPIFASSDDIAAALEQLPVARLLVDGYRGGLPVTGRTGLVVLLSSILEFAAAVMPEDVREFEINPLVFTEDGPVALDAVLRPGAPTPRTPAPARPLHKLRLLLEPRSIAIVGVSERMNPGRVILGNILRSGFPRDRITVVKPGAASIEGCVCVPGLANLPAPVDLAVLSIDAAQVPEIMGEVIALRSAESIILIPGGLGEKAGTEAASEEVAARVQEARGTEWGGPVVNGGNSLGVRSIPGHYDTFFIPAHKLTDWNSPPAPVAVVSQSGALTLSRLDRLPWLRPRYVVSVGNQIDLTVGDYMDLFAEDPEVALVACYVEGFRPGDGTRWMEAAARMRKRGGAVILYRAGRTPAGAQAAATHTATLAGDYWVSRALAEQAGVIVAESLADFEDLLTLAQMLKDRRVDGLRLGAVSNAGFECVAVADNLGPLRTDRFTVETAERIEGLLVGQRIGSIVGVGNPLDLTPVAGDAVFAEIVELVLGDAAVDVGIVGCVPFTPALQTLPPGPSHQEDVAGDEALAGLLIRLYRASNKAWVVVIDAGAAYDPMARLLVEGGIPTFRNADRAVRLFGRYCAWRTGRSTPAVPE